MVLTFKNKFLYIPFFILVVLSIWWIYIYSLGTSSTEYIRQIWAAIYQVMAIYGGIVGLIISRRWGGYKSVIGKSIIFFSIGLFFQSFGQSVYSYFIFKGIPTPYPSIGDIGFFGSVICYIIAVYYLAKISGLKYNFKSLGGKLITLLIPIGMLVFSYFFFLNGYEFDWSNKLKIFLDFGYPFGQALYVSLAIIALLMCQKSLGGIMKKPILFLVFALIFQYFSDFMFLCQANRGTWYVGGINDYMYFVSYFIMTLGLIYIGGIFTKIQNTQNS